MSDQKTCKFCHQTPDFFGDFFEEWGPENNINLAKGSWTSLCIGVDRDGNTVLRAFGDGIAEYYPKFCPECGRKLEGGV